MSVTFSSTAMEDTDVHILFAFANAAASSCATANRQPRVVHHATAPYPDSARVLGLGNEHVEVLVTLSPTGSVTAERIARSSGDLAIDQAALQAARKSTYSPEVVNCQPVRSDLIASFDFQALRDDCVSIGYPPSQEYDILVQRRDYQRALEIAGKDSAQQLDCAQQMHNAPGRFALEQGAASTLSRAADLAFSVGRYSTARAFATRANAVFQRILPDAASSWYPPMTVGNIRANMQANTDLLVRIAQSYSSCGSVDTGAIARLVLGDMPAGSTVHSVTTVGAYATAIAFGPDGTAVRSFLLMRTGDWTIVHSEGGAFDMALFQLYHIPASVAAQLAATRECATD